MGGIWEQLGLQLPRKRPQRRRCSTDTQLSGATHPSNVWCYGFDHDRFADAGAFRVLFVLDEHNRACLAIKSARSITSQNVVLVLSLAMRLCDKPPFIRSDQSTEFTAGPGLTAIHTRTPKAMQPKLLLRDEDHLSLVEHQNSRQTGGSPAHGAQFPKLRLWFHQ